MAQSAFTGPVISLGGVAGGPQGSNPIEYSDEIGPSLLWNGLGVVMGGQKGSKDRKGAGALRAVYLNSTYCACNAVLIAGGTALTTAANAVNGTPLALTTTFAAGVAPLCPVSVPGSGIVNGVAMDMGFATAATTATSATITITEPWRFYVGMWISLGGCGTSGAVQFASIVTVTATTLVLDRAIITSQTAAPIGHVSGNPGAYGFTGSAYSNSIGAGSGRFFNPDCGVARGVAVLGVTGGAGGNILIKGLDINMQPQSEVIAATAGATTTYGVKTYKVLLSATPQFADAHNYTIQNSDLIGFPFAVVAGDGFPPLVLTSTTGATTAYTTSVTQAADFTNPATTATKDPRGGVQLSAKGPNSGASGTGPNGTNRFTITAQLNAAQVFAATTVNYQALYGVTPV